MIAIDIEMPESCWDCELHNYHFCDVTGHNIEDNLNNGKREYDCPLRPIEEVS